SSTTAPPKADSRSHSPGVSIVLQRPIATDSREPPDRFGGGGPAQPCRPEREARRAANARRSIASLIRPRGARADCAGSGSGGATGSTLTMSSLRPPYERAYASASPIAWSLARRPQGHHRKKRI